MVDAGPEPTCGEKMRVPPPPPPPTHTHPAASWALAQLYSALSSGWWFEPHQRHCVVSFSKLSISSTQKTTPHD